MRLPQWTIILTSVIVAAITAANGGALRGFLAEQQPAPVVQTLSAAGVAGLHGIADSGRNADLRWPDFTPYKTEVARLYETNAYSLVWWRVVQDREIESEMRYLLRYKLPEIRSYNQSAHPVAGSAP